MILIKRDEKGRLRSEEYFTAKNSEEPEPVLHPLKGFAKIDYSYEKNGIRQARIFQPEQLKKSMWIYAYPYVIVCLLVLVLLFVLKSLFKNKTRK